MKSREKSKGEMREAFEQMWEELYEWRAEHRAASFDEIAAQVTPRRQALMGHLLGQLATQPGQGIEVEGVRCEACGEEMSYKGLTSREVAHLEGETQLERGYYHCAACERGLFPPG